MQLFVKTFMYEKDKSLGINLCYEENKTHEVKEHELLILNYKEIYINICLIWLNIVIGLKTKPKELLS